MQPRLCRIFVTLSRGFYNISHTLAGVVLVIERDRLKGALLNRSDSTLMLSVVIVIPEKRAEFGYGQKAGRLVLL